MSVAALVYLKEQYLNFSKNAIQELAEEFQLMSKGGTESAIPKGGYWGSSPGAKFYGATFLETKTRLF